MKLEIEGKVNLSSSQLEILAASANGGQPTRQRKPLTKERAYKLLDQDRSNEWILERYDITKAQLAGYRAWRARGEE